MSDADLFYILFTMNEQPKWKVILSAPYMVPHVERFRPLFEEHNIDIIVPDVKERLSEEQLLPIIQDIDGILCGDDRLTDQVLSEAKKLKVISKWGTGTDSIDKESATRRGIAVRNTINAFSVPVADTVLGYMLSFARDIPWTTQAMREGKWQKKPIFALHELTLGVVGVGNVGKAVIRRARAFDMPVLGCDVIPVDPEFLKETNTQMVPLDELCRKADFITFHCDLNPSSRHICNEKEIALMKPTAVVINTSRGPVIDEKALIRALQEKKLAGVALDVFEEEPLSADSPLCTMPNVLLAPHNANSSPFAWERVHLSTINHLIEELEKQPVTTS